MEVAVHILAFIGGWLIATCAVAGVVALVKRGRKG
jgi:hypothetical protein